MVLVLLGSMLVGSFVQAGDIVVASWNIQRLGHGEQKSFPALAAIASKADLLAIQEVMNEEGLMRLKGALEKHTGESWGHLVSHAIGSTRYKEMYAFLWRESAVEYSGGAVVYLDRHDHFIREPFSATFTSRSDGTRLALSTIHVLFGKSVADRLPEIQALDDYFVWLQETYPGMPVVLAGDFNLPDDHPAWAPLKVHARPLVTQGATTLSEIDGRYANRYDNLWVEHGTALPIRDAGIIDFPRLLGWTHSKSRRHVSDHAPVYMVLGNASLDRGKLQVAELAPEPVAGLASPSVNAGGAVRGNRNSKIYHRPDCPSYNRVGEANRVPFPSAQAAQSAGYRLAGNCP